MKLVPSILVISIFLFSTNFAHSCACCSDPNTLVEYDVSFFDLNGIKFEGDAGVYIYGEKGEDFDVGKSQIIGTVNNDTIQLVFRRNGKSLGTLTLKAKKKIVHKKVGLDFLLMPKRLQKLGIEGGMPLYHEIMIDVSVSADKKLKKALGLSFSTEGTFGFHGYSNSCWNPNVDPGQWSFRYSVLKNSKSEKAMARGKLIAG